MSDNVNRILADQILECVGNALGGLMNEHHQLDRIASMTMKVNPPSVSNLHTLSVSVNYTIKGRITGYLKDQ